MPPGHLTSIICPQTTSTSIICPQALPPTHPPTHLQSTTNTYTTRPSSPIGPCSAQTTNFGFYIHIPGPPSQDSVWSCEFAIPLVQWFVPRAHRPTNACLFCLMMHCKDFNPPSQVLKREKLAEPILLLPPVISKQPVQMTRVSVQSMITDLNSVLNEFYGKIIRNLTSEVKLSELQVKCS